MKKTQKIWFIPLLAICLLLFSSIQITAFAAGDFYTEGYFEYSMTGSSITIESYFGSESEVVIPDHIAALPVTKIENTAFAENNTITKIIVPDTVTEIGSDVFTSMKQLKEVVVQSVGLAVNVPSGCKLTEDYPVYVNPDSDESSSTDKDTTEQKPDADSNSSSKADKNNNSNIKDNNNNSNNDANEKKNEASNSGVGFEAAVENADDTQDRSGIQTADNKLITVDDTNNLIEIDENGEITVLDRNHTYTLTEENGQTVIKDEEGKQVSVTEVEKSQTAIEDEEDTQVSSDKDEESLDVEDMDETSVSETDNNTETSVPETDNNTEKQETSNQAGIMVAVIAGVIIVAVAGIVFWKKRRQY